MSHLTENTKFFIYVFFRDFRNNFEIFEENARASEALELVNIIRDSRTYLTESLINMLSVLTNIEGTQIRLLLEEMEGFRTNRYNQEDDDN